MKLTKILKFCLKEKNWQGAVSELISLLESYGFGDEAHRKQELLRAEMALIYKEHARDIIQIINYKRNAGEIDPKHDSEITDLIKCWYDVLIP